VRDWNGEPVLLCCALMVTGYKRTCPVTGMLFPGAGALLWQERQSLSHRGAQHGRVNYAKF